MTAPEPADKVVRLSVNLAPEVADVLTGWAAKKGISATEAVRRAIAVWNFVETEIANGSKVAVVEANGHIREVVVVE